MSTSLPLPTEKQPTLASRLALAVGCLDMKTPKNEDDQAESKKAEEVQYDDFGQRTPTRDYKLVVEGRTLFVNAHWLGDLSSYFFSLFFGGFSEQGHKSAKLEEETYEAVLELLRCVMDCPVRKPIDEDNVEDMLAMSSLYDFKALHIGCVKFINEHLGDLDDALVLGLLQTAAKHRIDTVLLDRLANHVSNNFPLDQLESLRGKVDADVLVDLYIAKSRKLCNELEMERARNTMPYVSADVATKKRKLAPDVVDPNEAFACARCKREGRAPLSAISAHCPRCGSYRCSPKCKLSTCKGH